MSKGKFIVGQEYRRNRLAKEETPIIAEVYYRNKDTKIYTNIHYTKAFANKVFRNDLEATYIVFKHLDDKKQFVLHKPNLEKKK